MSCAFHALNGRNLFGRILVAKPHPLIPMASFPINQSNPLPPPIPVCDQNVATRIGRLLVARPDFYNAVILLLNNHGLPSPFYDTSQSPSHMPVLDDKAPAITERVKRSASDIENSEIVPSSISKVPKLVETDEGVLSAEVNQPLHFQPRETSSKPPTVRNLSLLLDSFSASQSSGHPVEVVPFATQSSLDSDTAGFAPVVCITKEQLVSNRITEDRTFPPLIDFYDVFYDADWYTYLNVPDFFQKFAPSRGSRTGTLAYPAPNCSSKTCLQKLLNRICASSLVVMPQSNLVMSTLNSCHAVNCTDKPSSRYLTQAPRDWQLLKFRATFFMTVL